MTRRLWVQALDAAIALLVLMSLFGWPLRHAADPRRAALIIALAAAAISPAFRQESRVVATARSAAAALESARIRHRVLGAWVLILILLSVSQTLALRVPLYDVGIFHQILWALSHGHGFLSSISGAGDFLTDHASLSLALLAPIYWMSLSSALTLAVVHPILIGLGAYAWVWLAQRLSAKPTLAAAASVFVISFDSLWGNRYWGFHENAIAFAALSWAIALIFAGRTGRACGLCLAALLLLLTAATKEILLLDAAVAFVVWTMLRDQKPWTRVAQLAAAIALIAAFFWFESLPHPEDKNYFRRYYAYLGLNTEDFVRALFKSPGRVIENVGWPAILGYLKLVFLPFFPVFLWLRHRGSRRELWWLAVAAASFASALLATYPPLRMGRFHYVLELWPVLACLAIAALARLGSARLAWAWALVALLAWDHDPIGELRDYLPRAYAQSDARARMSEIPSDASIAASELAGPWVASRARATRLPALPDERCPDWFVVQNGDGVAEKPLADCRAELAWKTTDWSGYRSKDAN